MERSSFLHLLVKMKVEEEEHSHPQSGFTREDMKTTHGLSPEGSANDRGFV